MFFFTGLRRRFLGKRPFPSSWLAILEQIPFYRLLPAGDRQELQGYIRIFLAEKRFEGGGGFPVSDEVRVVIAAHAALLLIHRDTGHYPGLSSIVVYPGEFVAQISEVDEAGIVTEGEDIRSGESWQQGTLVLSWEDVLLGGQPGYEDYNVIIHEFAHQLDSVEGITTGNRPPWQPQMAAAYERFRRETEREEPTFLDPYGAESPEEFFAVAVEAFFTLPVEFRAELPELYAELARWCCQDPAEWPGHRMQPEEKTT